MANANLSVVIRARDLASKQIQDVGTTLGRTADRMSSIGTRLSIGLTLPFAAASAAVIKLASNASENENLFAVSMGDMEGAARQFSENLRAQFGLNAVEVNRMVGTFNVMLTSMGLAKQAAFDVSTGLVKLGEDLASFFNLSESDAMDKLRSGIVGEVEPLRRLGIVLSETAVQQFALSQGLIEAGQEMTDAQKIVARYGLIMQSTQAAQGDLARTQDSFANQLRRTQNEFKAIGQAVGKEMLPIVSGALIWLNNTGLPAAKTSVQKFGAAWGEMSEFAKSAVLVTAALLVTGGPLIEGLSFAFRAVVALRTAFQTLKLAAVGEFVAIGLAGAAMGVAIANIFGLVIGKLKEGIGEASIFLGQQFIALGGKLKTAGFGDLGGRFQAVGESMRQAGIESSVAGQRLVEFTSLGNIAKLGLDAIRAAGETTGLAVTTLSGQIGTFTKDELAALVQKISDFAGVTERATRDNDLMGRSLDATISTAPDLKAAFDSAAAAAGKAADKAREMGISTGDLVRAMVAVHPAVAAATAQVKAWEARISDVNAAIRANQDQLKSAQADYQRMGERLSNLNRELSETQKRFSELQSPRLTGMGEFEEQINAIQTQLKRVRLAELLGVPLQQVAAKFPQLTSSSEAFLATLPQTSEALQRVLDKLQLEQGLTFDEPLRQLKKAAEGAQPELTFDVALKSLLETKQRMVDLTGAVAEQEGAMRRQQGAISSIQAEGERLNATLATYQEQLRQAQTNLDLVTNSLVKAFTWFIEDRQQLIDMGGAAVDQVGLVDKATREMLKSVDKFTDEVATGVNNQLDDVVKTYQRSVDEAIAALNTIPRDITITLHPIKAAPEPVAAAPAAVEAPAAPAVGSVAPESFRPQSARSLQTVVVNVNAQNVMHDQDFETMVLSAFVRANRRGAILAGEIR